LIFAIFGCSNYLGVNFNEMHGSYGQGKSEKNQKKAGNFTFQSQGNIRGSGKVRENQSTRVQKLTKIQKKV